MENENLERATTESVCSESVISGHSFETAAIGDAVLLGLTRQDVFFLPSVQVQVLNPCTFVSLGHRPSV